MKNEVLIILLDQFADWEAGFIAPALNAGIDPESKSETKYEIKILSLAKDPIFSIGGLKVLPDYDIQSIPKEHAGLILIGGMKWFTPETKHLIPIIEDALEKNLLVAGICNASVFLGMNGFLDNVKHTSNTLEYLREYAGIKYRGEKNYIHEQAVRDGNIVTANGSGYLEFCREILYALEVDEPKKIEDFYTFNKVGLCEFMK